MIIPKPEFRLIDTGNPPRFQLTKAYIITLDDGLRIVIPLNFITDLASIPSWMWNIPGFAPDGPLAYGSIPHDFGYQYGYLLAEKDSNGVTPFPEASLRLHEQFKDLFGNLIPVYVGRPQSFFDQLLAGITREATGKAFVPGTAEIALKEFGHVAWNKYRTKGPTAFNANSLELPGLLTNGGYAY